MFPTTRRLTAIRLLTAAAVSALVMLAATPANAGELAPVPAAPQPNLWAEIETECFGDGSSPGIRWRAGNNTNGTHVLSLIRNDSVVYDVVIAPGEEKTSALHAAHWDDTFQHFQMRWKSQDQVLAQAKPWLNCVEPELAVSFDPADVDGAPCSGPVTATVHNSGTQNGEVRIVHGGDLVDHFVVATGSAVGVDLDAEAGTWLAGTVWDHGAHEFFFEVAVVDCPDAPSEPGPEPAPDPNGDGPLGEPGELGEPGLVDELPSPVTADRSPAPDAEVTGLTLDREISLLLARQPSDDTLAAPGGATPWILGFAVLLGAAALTARIVTARR